MATRAIWGIPALVSGSTAKRRDVRLPIREVRVGSPPGASNTKTYFMRARDVDCVSLTFRYWKSASLDLTAAEYVGARCGASPLVEIACLRVR